MRGRLFLLVGLLFVLLSDVNAATTISDAPFASISDALVAWLSGSLGLMIALFGMMASVLWYLTHFFFLGEKTETSGLLKGMVLSFLVGGVVGLVQAMVNLGRGSFN